MGGFRIIFHNLLIRLNRFLGLSYLGQCMTKDIIDLVDPFVFWILRDKSTRFLNQHVERCRFAFLTDRFMESFNLLILIAGLD